MKSPVALRRLLSILKAVGGLSHSIRSSNSIRNSSTAKGLRKSRKVRNKMSDSKRKYWADVKAGKIKRKDYKPK